MADRPSASERHGATGSTPRAPLDTVQQEWRTVPASGGAVAQRWVASRTRIVVTFVGLIIAALVTAVVCSTGLVRTRQGDPLNQDWVIPIVLVIFAPFMVEFIDLLALGIEVSASPDGLGFRFGRRRFLYRWSTVAGITAGTISAGVRPYSVLQIDFLGPGYRPPLAWNLWGSSRTSLRINGWYFPGIAGVAAGLEAARVAWSDAAVDAATEGDASAAASGIGDAAGPRYTQPRPPDRPRSASLTGVSVTLALVATFWALCIVSALADTSTGAAGVVAAILFALLTVGFGLGARATWRRAGRTAAPPT